MSGAAWLVALAAVHDAAVEPDRKVAWPPGNYSMREAQVANLRTVAILVV